MPECSDSKCPIHGVISVRGTLFTGVVVSAKPGKTVAVERTIVRYVPKYERYAKSKSRIYAHNPNCINAKEDDIVKVGETRKLSKTKSFVVLKVVGKKRMVKVEEDTFHEKKKEKEAGKTKEQESEPALREESGKQQNAEESGKRIQEEGKEEQQTARKKEKRMQESAEEQEEGKRQQEEEDKEQQEEGKAEHPRAEQVE